MLITTSRKPSARTRSFCQSLNRVLKSKYVNRGKMSIRDVLIKSSELGFEKTAIVSQIKGNPSRIEFYNETGEFLLSMNITVALGKERIKIKKDDLKIKYEVDGLKEKLSDILNIPEEKDGLRTNIILVKKGTEGNKAIIEFYDNDGMLTGLKIYVSSWR